MGSRDFAISACLISLHIVVILIGTIGCTATAPPVVHTEANTSAASNDPESVIRLLIQANADKDLETMKQYMATDENAVGYTIGGRKYVGWDNFAQVMTLEFASVDRLEIPITYLQVWQRNDVAWFAMEIDYTREVTSEKGDVQRTVIPLRETGVLERRDERWVMVNWHESLQKTTQSVSPAPPSANAPVADDPLHYPETINLSGEWEIHEEDKSYRATLDENGNGPYTWQEGVLTTTGISEGLWSGTWAQKANDREGGFEVLLSKDLTTAQGVWWYTRVGEHHNIPPREWGGSYILNRVDASPVASTGP